MCELVVPGQRRQALVGELNCRSLAHVKHVAAHQDQQPHRHTAVQDMQAVVQHLQQPIEARQPAQSASLRPHRQRLRHLHCCTPAQPRPSPAGHAHCVHDHVLGLLGVARLAVVRVMCPAHPARAACAAAGQHEPGVVPAVPLEQRRCLAPVCPVTVATITRNGRHLPNGRHQQWPQ